MPLTLLPIETITLIFHHLDECEAEKQYCAEKHREMCTTLMAIRLTCKGLEEIATSQLFRTFCLSPSWESWKKFHAIAASKRFRAHLQNLAFERHYDCGKFYSYDAWYEYTRGYQQTMRNVSNSSVLYAVDLSLFPNLKIVKAEDKWLITKKARSNFQIPFGHCQVRAISFGTTSQEPVAWIVLSGLAKITHYDFQIFSLTCRLGSSSPWRSLVNIDFSGLKYLSLYFHASPCNDGHDDLPADTNLLAKLQHLPNLEEFHLDQFFHRRSAPSRLMLRSMTEVLKQLRTKDWPRLRHLDLRFLTTTVADFKAFVAPHAGTLKTFHLHGRLKCARVTTEEMAQRYQLPDWARTVICPGGEEVRCTQLWGQTEECFEVEDEVVDVEELEDSEEEDEGGENLTEI